MDGITDVSPCFFGTFDGGNHAISGIVVQNDGTDKSVYAGFFGYIERDSKNPNFDFDVYRYPRLLSINIVNAYIEGADKVMEYSVPTSPNPLKVEHSGGHRGLRRCGNQGHGDIRLHVLRLRQWLPRGGHRREE